MKSYTYKLLFKAYLIMSFGMFMFGFIATLLAAGG